MSGGSIVPRSRNIKPGFFKNEELAECPFEGRILFCGLWCLCDREGRMEYRPRKIKAELFPYDEGIDVDRLVRQLEERGFVRRWSVEGMGFLEVLKFREHQNPHHRESQSVIPSPPWFEDQEEERRVREESGPQPWDVFEAIFLEQGVDCSEMPDGQKVKQLAVAKRLLADGIGPDQSRMITRWLLGQSWVQSVDVFLVEKQVTKWIAAGKPSDFQKVERSGNVVPWRSKATIYQESAEVLERIAHEG
jgi:hypothetical protein